MNSLSDHARATFKVFAAAIVWCVGMVPARAGDDFLASLRLRGGYDSNPQFATGLGIGGSTFLAADTALAAGGQIGAIKLAVAAEGSAVHYGNPLMTPSLTGKVLLRGSVGDDAFRASATTELRDVSTYNLRSSEFAQSVKLETKRDALKLFVTAEGGLSKLNQTNAIFPTFFPWPHQFWRATLIPGASIVRGKGEVGVSVNLSARRYADEFDIFGYRRDNERLEPFVFAKYSADDLTVFAALSRLHGRWHDPDFSDVDRVLFDATLNWKIEPFSLDLVAARRAVETTFPISPITIDSIFTAKASWQLDDKWVVTASAGYTDTEYLDSDFRARTLSYGIGVTRDIGHDFKLGFDVSRLTGKLISGEQADALIVAGSLSKRFVGSGESKPATAEPRS